MLAQQAVGRRVPVRLAHHGGLPQLRESMPVTKEYREIRVCQCCTVVGRSCRGTGGGPIKCLKAQGWNKSAKGIWYCPACRYENVDVPYDWSPDWRALQNEVQCWGDHYESWTCRACDAQNWPWRTQCRRCNMRLPEVPVPEYGGVEVPVPEDGG